MKNKNGKNLLFFGIITLIAAGLQIFGTVRYIHRMPGDTIGIIIYSVVSVLFILLTIVNFASWRKSFHEKED